MKLSVNSRIFFLLLVLSMVVLGCTDKKSLPKEENTVETDTTKVESATPVTQSDSDGLLELFTKKKEEVVLKLKGLSKEEANKLYETYFEENNVLLGKIAEKENGLLEKFYSEAAADKKNIELLNQKLLKHELEFEEIGEGYVEITTKNDFYYSIFKNYVSEDYKDYLQLKSEENKTMYSSDAGLVISFKDLGDRIISWENFIAKYPNSKLMESVKEEYKNYQMDYLRGMDNTPTTENANPENKYIYPENIQEFNRFLKKYPKSPTVPLINFFTENFKNDDIGELLSKEQEKL